MSNYKTNIGGLTAEQAQALAGIRRVRTTDPSSVTSTTLADDSVLSVTGLAAGTYNVTGLLKSVANEPVKWAIASAGATGFVMWSSMYGSDNEADLGSAFFHNNNSTGDYYALTFSAVVILPGTGDITVQWASRDGNSARAARGSYMHVLKIA